MTKQSDHVAQMFSEAIAIAGKNSDLNAKEVIECAKSFYQNGQSEAAIEALETALNCFVAYSGSNEWKMELALKLGKLKAALS